jgi:hypothetical protein
MISSEKSDDFPGSQPPYCDDGVDPASFDGRLERRGDALSTANRLSHTALR